MRAFLVRLPSGVRYWTVIDEDLVVSGEADAFLRHVRFGRDGSELTTRSYAGGIAFCVLKLWSVETVAVTHIRRVRARPEPRQHSQSVLGMLIEPCRGVATPSSRRIVI